MKRYMIRSLDRKVSAQFPAVNLADAMAQAERHSKALNLAPNSFRVSYVGKWRSEVNPDSYNVK